ncbi:MAG: peptide/nickel transport system permease protein [Thermomicrobiales bacterium]|nr:peptide/nickel transport system permease protein [Thermomicrobiales bacterium]
MRLEYVVRRLLLFFVVLWAAATLNFFLPRIAGQNPIRTRLLEQAAAGGYVQAGLEDMVAEYERKFGLDRPLWRQYFTYLGDIAQFDFGYSIVNYPQTVLSIMGDAAPWTVGLLLTTTLIAFGVGTLLGALLAWPRSPRFIQFLFPPLLTFSAVPYFLLGLVLLYLFAFKIRLLPLFGGYSPGIFPNYSLDFAFNVLKHSVLPACSILLASLGFWALGMRGMMVTVEGEDYMTFAEAAGLKGKTLFFTYALRNALLPQTTALGLALAQILSGALLVEVIFSYPGIGSVLYHAIRRFDYFLIQGIIFTIVLGLTLATLILDLIYPLLDPRISYRRS